MTSLNALCVVVFLSATGLHTSSAYTIDREMMDNLPNEQGEIELDVVEEGDMMEPEFTNKELDAGEVLDVIEPEITNIAPASSISNDHYPEFGWGWSAWTNWYPCVHNMRTRVRVCHDSSHSCPGQAFQTQPCNEGHCPHTHRFAFFDGLRCCSKNKELVYASMEGCDGNPLSLESFCCDGIAINCQHKRCSNFISTDRCKEGTHGCHANANCKSTSPSTFTCKCKSGYSGNGKVCAVNGAWSAWESFGKCTKTCGGGVKTRTRFCNNPAPAKGGSSCPGSNKITHQCNMKACPPVIKDIVTSGHKTKAYYPKYKLKFVGNGFPLTFSDRVTKFGISFEQCLDLYAKNRKGHLSWAYLWNGLTYRWRDQRCEVYRQDIGNLIKNDLTSFVHYRVA